MQNNIKEIENNIYEDWARKHQKFIKKFNSLKGNCVALAIPISSAIRDDQNCYLAISGTWKDYDGQAFPKTIDSRIANTYIEINNLLESLYGFRFIECHLIDDTRRYTYLDSKKIFDIDTVDGRVLTNPIRFSTDFKKNGKNHNLVPYYSCCEKKIISHMNFINRDYGKLLNGKKVVNYLTSYLFKIQKEPCRMCRPALIGCYFIGFNFADFNGFINLYNKWGRIVLQCGNIKEPLTIKTRL